MANLGIMGGVSLGTINQWISLIDTNLTNSKRIGYKETRVSMTSGEVNTIGMTQGPGKIMPIAFPSASLLIGKTQILDYVQGNLTQTGQITDFALNGRGYFVVEDKLGNRYATRDGQFNFDTEGYLVTQEGLRVLTTGMDYVKVPASENFAVNSEGESQSTTTSTYNPTGDQRFISAAVGTALSTSIYGNRKLLVIDIPNANKLVYSKYGYTKFELGSRIPITVRNDFSTTMDGIAPYLSDIPAKYNNSTIPPTLISPAVKMSDFFRHDVQNGTVKMASHDAGGNLKYVQAGYGGQQYKEFNTELDFNIRTSGTSSFDSFGITFGKSEYSSTDADNDVFFAGIVGNQFVIRKGGFNIASQSIAISYDSDNTSVPLLSSNKITIKLDVEGGVIKAQLFQGGSPITATPLTATYAGYSGGYMSVGSNAQFISTSPSAVPPEDNIIEMTNMTVIQRNSDSEYTTNVLQQNIKDIWKDGADTQIRETMVMQQYVEESTSTLADTLPLLSHAQKMFGAISKVISVYNSITDDMNNSVR